MFRTHALLLLPLSLIWAEIGLEFTGALALTQLVRVALVGVVLAEYTEVQVYKEFRKSSKIIVSQSQGRARERGACRGSECSEVQEVKTMKGCRRF